METVRDQHSPDSQDPKSQPPQPVDAQAEEELIARFRPRVRAFVASRAAGRDFLEEVVQDTLMAMITSLRTGTARDPENMAAMVYGIARNKLADAIRKKARDRTQPMPKNFDFPAPESEQEPELVNAARREIDVMEPTDRRILWMTLIDGFKPGEVAESMGISPEAVRQRKSRALKRLVERLRPLSRKGSESRLTRMPSSNRPAQPGGKP